MKPVFSTFALALTLATTADIAAAEQVCMPTHEMKAALIDWYGERPLPGQERGNDQLWVSDDTGTWTLVKTLSDGNACVIAQGEEWMAGMASDQIIAALNN